MTPWRKITCEEREELFNRIDNTLTIAASLTDPDGRYGEPRIFTEWADRATEVSVLRDVRWPHPNGGRDLKPCEHYVPAPTPEGTQP